MIYCGQILELQTNLERCENALESSKTHAKASEHTIHALQLQLQNTQEHKVSLNIAYIFFRFIFLSGYLCTKAAEHDEISRIREHYMQQESRLQVY